MAKDELFERFECAPGIRLKAHERLTQVHYDTINRRLERLETVMERLERRLWLMVYGIAAMALAQTFQSILAVTP